MNTFSVCWMASQLLDRKHTFNFYLTGCEKHASAQLKREFPAFLPPETYLYE